MKYILHLQILVLTGSIAYNIQGRGSYTIEEFPLCTDDKFNVDYKMKTNYHYKDLGLNKEKDIVIKAGKGC